MQKFKKFKNGVHRNKYITNRVLFYFFVQTHVTSYFLCQSDKFTVLFSKSLQNERSMKSKNVTRWRNMTIINVTSWRSNQANIHCNSKELVQSSGNCYVGGSKRAMIVVTGLYIAVVGDVTIEALTCIVKHRYKQSTTTNLLCIFDLMVLCTEVLG